MGNDTLYFGFMIGVLVVPVMACLAVAGMAIQIRIQDWLDVRSKNIELESKLAQYKDELEKANKQLEALNGRE